MICPKCDESLPDDYDVAFCDQCNADLYHCADPNCAGYRMLTLNPENRCSQCGEPVVPNGPQEVETGDTQQQQVQTQSQVQTSAAPIHQTVQTQPHTASAVHPAQQQSSHPMTEGMPGAGERLFFAHTNGWQIELADDDILGRVYGRFTEKLGSAKFVSGTHAKISRRQDGWYITDQGSKNKTWVNGKEAPPNVPILLKPNDTVTLASEKFIVIIS